MVDCEEDLVDKHVNPGTFKTGDQQVQNRVLQSSTEEIEEENLTQMEQEKEQEANDCIEENFKDEEQENAEEYDQNVTENGSQIEQEKEQERTVENVEANDCIEDNTSDEEHWKIILEDMKIGMDK